MLATITQHDLTTAALILALIALLVYIIGRFRP